MIIKAFTPGIFYRGLKFTLGTIVGFFELTVS